MALPFRWMVVAPDLYNDTNMDFSNSLEFAEQLDAQDVLRHFRNEFLIPEIDGDQVIYFLGNSLGLQPKRTALYIEEVLQQWQQYGVEAFFKGEKPWLSHFDQLKEPLAMIVGARPQE